MNILDIAVIAIIAFFAVKAYRGGFVLSCLSFLPSLCALIVTYLFQPVLSKFIRSTEFYINLKTSIGNFLSIDNVISNSAMQAQSEIINNMNIPDFLKSTLMENNNPVIYNILNVESIGDYITGFIANIFINIVTMVLLFVVTSIVVKIIIKTLNSVSKLPVVNSLNKFAGLLVGFIQGAVIVWVICIGLTFFYFNPSWKEFFEMLDSSFIASFMYQNNILLFMILRIFG